MRIGVIGAGAFGTALANLLANKSHEVRLWAREPELVQALNERHENALYLPGIPLSPSIQAFERLDEAVHEIGMLLLAAPSHGLREVASRLAPHLPPNIPIVTVTKGIENETLLTMSELLEDVLPTERHPYLAIVSGPSFAREVAEGQPTSVTVASRWERLSQEVQSVMSTDTFRVYTSSDLVGVQYGGALKNVVAIGVGCAEGLGFGSNARAALITRGLAEIMRAAMRRGANPMTFAGLSGMGDLVLTCTGPLSRNRALGEALGRGQSVEEVQKNRISVAEGFFTAKSAFQLSTRFNIDMPISRGVYQVLFEGKPPREGVKDLLSRALKPEF